MWSYPIQMCQTPSVTYWRKVGQAPWGCKASACSADSVPKISACAPLLPGGVHCTSPRCDGSTSKSSE